MNYKFVCIFLLIITGLNGCIKNQDKIKAPSELYYNFKNDLMFIQLELEGEKITFLVSDPDSLVFFQKIKNTPKLFYYFSELNCNSCVEDNILVLNEFIKTFGEDKFVLIASYQNTRDLLIFRRINQIKPYIFNVSSLGIKDIHNPFCFVLNEHQKAECVYIPLKEDNENFKRYLQVIQKKYFK